MNATKTTAAPVENARWAELAGTEDECAFDIL